MSWKSDLQLRDLDEAQAIEVLCRRCNDAYYEQAASLLEAAAALTPDTYLDEVEAHLTCKRWGCAGPVTISLTDSAETSGFVGGLP